MIQAANKADAGSTAAALARMVEAVRGSVVIREDVLRLAVVALMARGHVLLEDVPGVGKTLLARSLAQVTGGQFRRIQFTPDLLPADVTGGNIFDPRTSEFHFREGPVFANVVLADEINRGTPRTQSSLLEAMGERHVSVDGVTHSLPDPFLVIATQNPTEEHGTFPLPESELDRFMVLLRLGRPDSEQSREILRRHQHSEPTRELSPVLDLEDVIALQDEVLQVFASEAARDYIADIVLATRSHPQVGLPASPRASVSLLRAAQAMALHGARRHLLPDDVKTVAAAVLAHRLAVTGGDPDQVVAEIVESVPVPLKA